MSTEKQLTAVEYLTDVFFKSRVEKALFQDEIQQAKEMEKQQIVKAWENGKKSTQCKAPICQMKTGLGYYHKTFKSE